MSRFSKPRPPQATDPLAAFDSSEPTLNDWLRDRAVSNEAAGNSRTFVTVDMDTGLVAGYHCLCASALKHEDANGDLRKNSPNPISVILIGRLAVDKRCEGQGLGRSLLLDALSKAVSAARVIGARAVIVHAISDDAARFYEKYSFKMIPESQRTMYMLMQDIEATLSVIDSIP